MSWIHTVPESDAEGELADVYAAIEAGRGKVSNIMRVQSLLPGAMGAHMDLYLELLFRRGGLSRAERELIAVVVSAENRCRYCTLHHLAALEAWWKDPDRARRLADGELEAVGSPREAAIARHARELTRAPDGPGREGVEELRAVGLGDLEILQVTMVTAYFNFVNRVAEGLGVEAPPEEVGGYRY
jgi:uncharacterized peroxidase-related enzyme